MTDLKTNSDIAGEAFCPICSRATSLFDVVDFNKACGDPTASNIGLSGEAIYYARCTDCGFLYAPSLHAWSESQFLERIYNKDYIQFDGEYAEVRPRQNAQTIVQYFSHQRSGISHLDYGGGNGLTSKLLRNDGWNSVSFDPFPSSQTDITSLGDFNLITAFEVFEHVPDLHGMMNNLEKLLRPGGVVMLTTFLSDGQIKEGERLSWWYAAPRNGHISLFSSKALRRLAGLHGFNVRHLNQSLHLLFR